MGSAQQDVCRHLEQLAQKKRHGHSLLYAGYQYHSRLFVPMLARTRARDASEELGDE